MARKRKVDRPLRDDVRFLGEVLGAVLTEQEGSELFEREEQVRHLSIRRRRGPKDERAGAEAELAQLLSRLPAEQTEPLIRAFATYFALVNLAEQHHRIRRSRAHAKDPWPQRGSLADVLRIARDAGVSAAKARAAIATLQVTLTLTAHPTQASRRTILDKIDRIAHVLEDRDRCKLTPREVQRGVERIREEITALWQSDELRSERPTVGDEVKNVLWYVENVLWDLLPALPVALADAFRRVYGEELGMVPSPLRLHSWVGGDMDGNPLVTPEVLEDAIRAHRSRGLRRILASLRELGGMMSQSTRRVPIAQALRDSLEEDERRMPKVAERYSRRTAGEPFRRKLRFMEVRVAAALASTEAKRALSRPPDSLRLVDRLALGRDGVPAGDDGLEPETMLADDPLHVAYRDPEELAADLELVAESLREAKAQRAGEAQVRALLHQVRALGFHILELEMRAPADDARAAAAALDGAEPTEGGMRFFSSLQKIAQAQQEGGPHACRTLVLSMATSTEDLLATLRCAREAGLWDEKLDCATLDVVPLFETLQALDEGEAILQRAFDNPAYRRHVACRGGQEVMVGYSDSGKEVGLLAASGALWRIQSALPALAERTGIPIRIFHGRGESVARGGGPAQQAILALPAKSICLRYKATEQGEALDHKYARPALARRSLELIVGGALLHSLGAQERPTDEELSRFEEAYAKLGEYGRVAYRALVWEEPRFVEFFQAASPLAEIAELPIGSRPAKRRAGGVEALRAIPWVFAWTQNRAILPGWYGVGTALSKMGRRPDGKALLRRMYRRWPYFRAAVDNVEMVLAKSDLKIAARYAELASPEAREAVWPKIRAEYLRTRKWIKIVSGHERLLETNEPLQRSIALRNPYVDPMSFLQVELLRKKRAGDPSCDRSLLLTLNGIAAGMRNTG